MDYWLFVEQLTSGFTKPKGDVPKTLSPRRKKERRDWKMPCMRCDHRFLNGQKADQPELRWTRERMEFHAAENENGESKVAVVVRRLPELHALCDLGEGDRDAYHAGTP